MDVHEVMPDIVDTVPPQVLQVTYGSKILNPGDELTPTEVKDIPTVKWTTESGAFYTLIMTDADAPSRKEPTLRECKHWLVVNIPGDNIHEGDTITEYAGSGPPEDSGLHRYIFLVYKQPGHLKFDEIRASNRSLEGRLKFSSRKFAAKYNLGEPVAGNFYQAQYDDYVQILRKQFSQ